MELFPFANPITEATGCLRFCTERFPERSNLFKSHWPNQRLNNFSYTSAAVFAGIRRRVPESVIGPGDCRGVVS